MPCTAILALVLLASLPAASAAPPALRGSALIPESSVDHKNTDEVMQTCTELVDQGLLTSEHYNVFHEGQRENVETVLGFKKSTEDEKTLAAESLLDVLPQAAKILREVAAVLPKLEKCPENIEGKDVVVESLDTCQNALKKAAAAVHTILKNGVGIQDSAVRAGAAEQGFEGEGVKHKDGETGTSDWQSEYGAPKKAKAAPPPPPTKSGTVHSVLSAILLVPALAMVMQ